MGRLSSLRGFDNWVELVLGRTFFRGTHLQVHRVNGLEMVLDHRAADAGSIRGCVCGEQYRRHMPLLRTPDNASVLDVGSNVGGFPLLLASERATFGQLVCVEMNPSTYERLRFNIRHNWPTATVINAAVVSAARDIKVSVGIGSTADSIYRKSKGATQEQIVKGITLDDAASHIAGPIHLCKIDIEGAEDEVLLTDNGNSSLDRIQTLVMEMHNARSYAQIVDALNERGLKRVAGDGCGVNVFMR